jgi:hypothetical protein
MSILLLKDLHGTPDRPYIVDGDTFDEANDIHQGKPRMTWAVCYNNSRNVYLDCIGSVKFGTPGKGFFRAVFSVDHQDDGSDPQTRLYRCLATGPTGLQVKPFSNGTQEPDVQPTTGIIPGVQFIGCQDGCLNGHVDSAAIELLQTRWSSSPILERIKTLAGVDIQAQFDALRNHTPTPTTNPVVTKE